MIIYDLSKYNGQLLRSEEETMAVFFMQKYHTEYLESVEMSNSRRIRMFSNMVAFNVSYAESVTAIQCHTNLI